MRTVIVTGASGSMGSAAVRELSGGGSRVIMACRNIAKAETVRARVLEEFPEACIEIMELDLGSLASVRRFATSVQGSGLVLFNNAGVINRDHRLTEDGYERTYQVNFLAPALLTLLLSDRLARVVSMVSLTCSLVSIPQGYSGDSATSDGGSRASGSSGVSAASYSQLGSYARAKLAMLLFTLELGRRTSIDVAVADPGVVNSNMISMGRWFDPLADVIFRPLCSSPEKGVAPALRAIQSAETEPLYYVGRRARTMPGRFTTSSADSIARSLYELIFSAI